MLTDAWDPVWGGGQTHMQEVSKRLTSQYGHVVDIVVPNIKGKSVIKTLPVIKIGRPFKFPNLIGRILYIFSVAKFLLSSKYDIYHSHSFSTSIFLPLLRIFNKRVIFTLHGTQTQGLAVGIFNLFGLPKLLSDAWTYWFKYDALITVAKSSLIKKPKTKKIYVVGNGVDIEAFDKIKVTKNANEFRLLWVGRFVPIKNLPALIDAVLALKPDFPKLTLTLIGEGLEKEELQTRTNSFIKIKDFMSGVDLIKEYKMSNAYVLPSLEGEGFPVSVVEAMAAKLPVLATDIGDTKLLVTKKTGFLIGQSDLKAGIKNLLTDNQVSLKGQNGYELVKKKYTWTDIAKEINIIYETL